MISNVSTLAVILAAAVGFLASVVWYRAFGTAWLAALDKSREELRPASRTFLVAIVAQLIMAFVLGGLMAELDAIGMEAGMVVGAIVWLGFVATSTAVGDSFAGASVNLTLIDTGHWLVVLVLMGATIGLLSG